MAALGGGAPATKRARRIVRWLLAALPGAWDAARGDANRAKYGKELLWRWLRLVPWAAGAFCWAALGAGVRAPASAWRLMLHGGSGSYRLLMPARDSSSTSVGSCSGGGGGDGGGGGSSPSTGGGDGGSGSTGSGSTGAVSGSGGSGGSGGSAPPPPLPAARR